MTLKGLEDKYDVGIMLQESIDDSSIKALILESGDINYNTSFSREELGPHSSISYERVLCDKLDEFLDEKINKPPTQKVSNKLIDTGVRKEFESGAVREIVDDKGRCDLLPLSVLSMYLTRDGHPDWVLEYLHQYIYSGNINKIYQAMDAFNEQHWKNNKTMILEASRQYADGAKKYDDRNWEKGLPLHCFIDSGVRHYLKFLRGDTDEPHDRAFVWNMLGAAWTHENKPELIDLPFGKVKSKDIPDASRADDYDGDQAVSVNFGTSCAGCVYDSDSNCTSNKVCIKNCLGRYSGYIPKKEKLGFRCGGCKYLHDMYCTSPISCFEYNGYTTKLEKENN